MKVICIGNYPPRECGIATFTKDFIESVAATGEKPQVSVIAMNDHGQQYDYPDTVSYTINQNIPGDYIRAGEYINFSGADACILQHEFGIFGGNCGVFILPLIHRLKVPLTVIFHTVLKTPSYNEKNIIIEIGKKAAAIVVMNSMAIGILEEVYGIPGDKINVIPHGVPAYDFEKNRDNKKNFDFQGRRTLMTFGLLSRNKGLETVIEALPAVVKDHPDILYIILGKTHPGVVRSSGEEYRNYLKLLVRQYQLEENVFFDDRFVDTPELLAYLASTDIYITPYLHEAQITSGTLAYAVGAGTAVVSTPYWHAKEILADGRGRLFDFNDHRELSRILKELLDDPEKMKSLREKAFAFGRTTSWPETGSRYLSLLEKTARDYSHRETPTVSVQEPNLPAFSLDHILRLSDDTGILQHARYNVPRRCDGYCVDDNSRALLMVSMAACLLEDRDALKLIPVYMSFIEHMQTEDGWYRNFLSYGREFQDEAGSDDCFGRTMWALAFLMNCLTDSTYGELARELFLKGYGQFNRLSSLRGYANTIIGICFYLKRYPDDEGMLNTLKNMTGKLTGAYGDHRSADWHWYEPSLTYDNGIIPYALFHSVEQTGDKAVFEIARESLEFLDTIIFREGYLSLVGSKEWFFKDHEPSRFDQQPLNAMSIILMYRQAFVITGDKKYQKRMYDSFMWFLGENDLRIPIYDFETKGCNDGLTRHGVNRNQGAESSIAFLISQLAVSSYFDLPGKQINRLREKILKL